MRLNLAALGPDPRDLAWLIELKAAGAERVWSEKESGAAVSNRRALAAALKVLGQGDVLIVTQLDRLARSTRDLLNTLALIADRGAGFKSLAEPQIDTTSAHGALVVTILGAIAEFERKLIKARCGEGRKRAMANGVRFGRKPKLTRHQIAEALARRETGESLTDIGKSYNVSTRPFRGSANDRQTRLRLHAANVEAPPAPSPRRSDGPRSSQAVGPVRPARSRCDRGPTIGARLRERRPTTAGAATPIHGSAAVELKTTEFARRQHSPSHANRDYGRRPASASQSVYLANPGLDGKLPMPC
jgi:DNA invertase Pin-like site-specific DNA recombinase